MSCSIIRDRDTLQVVDVLAPNGAKSILFQSLLDEGNTSSQALQEWAVAYTPSFKRFFGDWENASLSEHNVDVNGEPLLRYLKDFKDEVMESQPKTLAAEPQIPYGSTHTVEQILQRFTKVFPQLHIKQIAESSIRDLIDDAVDTSTVKAFVKNHTVYLVEGRVSGETALEEILHPFVHALENERRPLHLGLFRQAVSEFPAKWARIQQTYTTERGFTDADRQSELVTQALRDKVLQGLAEQTIPDGSVWQRFISWLKSVFKRLGVEQIPLTASLDDLAILLNTEGVQFELQPLSRMMYHLTPEPADPFEPIANPPGKTWREAMKEKKISRIDEQIAVVDQASRLKGKGGFRQAPTQQQKNTLDKLRENLMTYRGLLENNQDQTRSVTKLIGSVALEDTQQYQVYADFGTFMHSIIEELQKEALTRQESPSEIYSEEWFKNHYEKFGQKVEIKGLTYDRLEKLARNLVGKFSYHYQAGNIVLPEMTLYAQSRSGTLPVLGRIDWMVIDKSGKVDVFDLKTTKLDDGKTPFAALTRTYPVKQYEPGVDVDVQRYMVEKNKLMGYYAQTGVYRQMLMQLGIPVGDAHIVSLYYGGRTVVMPDQSEKFTFQDATIEDLNWLNYIYDVDPETNQPILQQRYAQVDQVVKGAIPVAGQVVNEFEAAQEVTRSQQQEEFQKLDELAVERLLVRMADQTRKNLDELRNEIKKARRTGADEAYIKSLQDRIDQFMRIRSFMERENVSAVIRLQEALNGLIADYNVMHERVTTMKQLPTPDQMTAWVKVNQQLDIFEDIFKTLKQLAIEAIEAEGTDLAKSPILRDMDTLLNKVAQDKNAYVDRAADAMIAFIRRENPEHLTKQLYETIQQVMPGEKLRLERQIKEYEKLLQGGWSATTSIGAQLKQALNLTDPAQYKKNLETAIKNATNRITEIDRKLTGQQSLTDEDITRYVKGFLTDQNSTFYLGSTMGSSQMGISVDDFFAGRVSPDLFISSLAGYLAKTQTKALDQFYREMGVVNIDKQMADFIGKMGGVEQANAAISEVVEVRSRDDEGNVSSTKHRSFIAPVSEVYKQEYDQFRFQLADAHDAVKRARQAFNDTGRVDPVLKKQLEVAASEANRIKRARHDWMMQHSEMPYIDKVYQMQRDYPTDIQDRLEEIENQYRIILGNNVNNEEMLTEDELDQLRYLDIERNKLFREAKERDPSRQTTTDEYNELFETTVNYSLYQRLKGMKEAELAQSNPKAFQLWVERNSVREITEEYYQDLQKIFDGYARINGSNAGSQIGEWNKERSGIVRKYFAKGEYDTSVMDEADMQRYEELTGLIDEAKANTAKLDLSTAQRVQLGQLTAQLNALRYKQLNPYYERRLKQEKEKLNDDILEIRKYDAMIGREMDPARKQELIDRQNAVKAQYFTKEEAFKAWFDQHNKKAYEPGTLLYGNLEDTPRDFHYQYVPASNKYYREVPNAKYRLRRHRKAAENPNYHVMPDGYPMPKGLKHDALSHRYTITKPAALGINPAFARIQNNPTIKSFYDFMVMDQYVGRQEKTFGKRLGFLYPGVQEQSTEEFLQDPKSAMERQWHELVDEKNLKASKLETARNDYGQTGRQRVVFKSNFALPEELTTRDGITAIIKWRMEASVNQAMGEANMQLTPMKDYIEAIMERMDPTDPKVRQLQKVLDQFIFEQNKFVYGQTMGDKDSAAKLDDGWLNRRNMKILFRAISFTRLGFDLPMQLGNLVSGNVQAYIASSRVKGTTDEDYLWSKYELYKSVFPQMLKDYGKISQVGFYTKFYRYLNPAQKDLDRALDLATRSKGRRVLNRALNFNEMSFVAQDKGELEIGLTTALMIYHAAKFKQYQMDNDGQIVRDLNGDPQYVTDSHGQIVHVHGMDAFVEDNQGGISRRKDIEMSDGEEQLLKERVYSEIIKVQGNYSSYSQTRAESFLLGRLLLFYRKYVPSVLSTRFGGANSTIDEMIDWRTNEISMGWYTAMYRMFQYYGAKDALKTLLPGKIRDKLGINTPVSDFFLHKKNQVMKEVIAATAAYLLYDMIRDMVLSSDEDDLSWLEMILMRTMIKVTNETRSVVPLPIIGKPEDYVDIFTNFTTATREFKTAFNGAKNLIYAVYGLEDGFYQRDQGYFERGDAKVWKQVHEIFGIDNFYNLENPYYKLKESIKAAP